MAVRKKTASASPRAWTIQELGAFYKDHRFELHSHASRILKDPARAEEVTQDALIKFLLAAPELESEEHAISYLHRTIENLCIDIFRLEGRRPNLVVLDDAIVEVERNWHLNQDHSDVIASAEDAAIIRQALAMLSAAERTALVMWEIEGRPTREIAYALGIRDSAVRHTVSRARASLRRVLAELVIDEVRGLTALDLLSISYKKASNFAKKSSKAALSLILILVAFLGFNAVSKDNGVTNNANKELLSVPEAPVLEAKEPRESGALREEVAASVPSTSKTIATVANAKSKNLSFPGLDVAGVPTGFTVADTSGSLGSAYFIERATTSTETELTIGQIFKTDFGAANIFISQTLTTDENGLAYRPVVSYGHEGSWRPLLVRVSSTDIERQMSGNYLFTAYIAVESGIDSPIKIAATAKGRDLAVAPRQVITRLVLDPSKTRVLAQAVLVVERGAKA